MKKFDFSNNRYESLRAAVIMLKAQERNGGWMHSCHSHMSYLKLYISSFVVYVLTHLRGY